MTPKEAKEIRRKCMGMCAGLDREHPLEGKSVAQWVAEARKGWPKVPVPGDPAKAAMKIFDKYAAQGVDVELLS